jgi:hypothetical protein
VSSFFLVQSFSTWGNFAFKETFDSVRHVLLTIWGKEWRGCYDWHLMGGGLDMLLNTLPCPGQSPVTLGYSTKSFSRAEVEKSVPLAFYPGLDG